MKWTCSLCGSSEIEDFVTKSDHILYHRCKSCSSVFRDHAHRLTPENEKKRYQLHNNSPDNAGYISWINSFLDFVFKTPLSPGSRILDFGSGPEPVMAGILEKRGYQVSIEDPYFSPGKPGGLFSLITLLEVFEHIPDPFKVMMNLASRLTDGGRLCISTEFLPSDFARFEYWRYRSDETHIGLYTGRGLAEAGQRAGFIEEDCDGKRYLSFRLAHRGSSC